MNTRPLIRTLVAMTAFWSFAGPVFAGGFLRPPDAIPDQYIVVLATDIPHDEVQQLAKSLSAQHKGHVRKLLNNAVRAFSVDMTESDAIALSKDPAVLLVEQNARMHLSVDRPLPPDDLLWNLDRVDQRALPLDHIYDYCETGAGVIAYLPDTGIMKTHHEFDDGAGNSRILNGICFANDCNNVQPGEFVDYGTLPCGGFTSGLTNASHGTSVASILGGKTVGVAKDVLMVPVRWLPCDLGDGFDTEHLAWGLDWIRSLDNPYRDVRPALISMSSWIWANDSLVSAVEHVINGLVLDDFDVPNRPPWKGIPVIVSANNQAGDACNTSPARMAYRNPTWQGPARVITVGATTIDDVIWSGSNRGNCVDIFAPGADVESADIRGNDTYRPSCYPAACRSGTSFAAPFVAGIVARILQVEPLLNPDSVWSRLEATASRPHANDPNHAIDPDTHNDLLAYKGAFECGASVPTSGQVGLPIMFSGSATVGPECGGTVLWSWSFGDGAISTSHYPTHAYSSVGTYSWQMTTTLGAATCSRNGVIVITDTSGGGGGNECKFIVDSEPIIGRGNISVLAAEAETAIDLGFDTPGVEPTLSFPGQVDGIEARVLDVDNVSAPASRQDYSFQLKGGPAEAIGFTFHSNSVDLVVEEVRGQSKDGLLQLRFNVRLGREHFSGVVEEGQGCSTGGIVGMDPRAVRAAAIGLDAELAALSNEVAAVMMSFAHPEQLATALLRLLGRRSIVASVLVEALPADTCVRTQAFVSLWCPKDGGSLCCNLSCQSFTGGTPLYFDRTGCIIRR